METILKRDLIKERYQSNLINKEILKTDDLIKKIDPIKNNSPNNK